VGENPNFKPVILRRSLQQQEKKIKKKKEMVEWTIREVDIEEESETVDENARSDYNSITTVCLIKTRTE
jgi:cell division protein FtsB